MPKFYSELQEASLENLAADPAGSVSGKIWNNTTEGRVKTDDGVLKRAILRNDDKAVIGNSVTANDNIRFNRAAASVIQLLQGGNSTAEGALSATAMAQLSARLENYTDAGKPAAGNPGRLIWVTDLLEVQFDNGATWLPIAGAGTGGWGALGVVVLSGNTVLNSGDNKQILLCDSTAGSFTITLPAPATNFLLSIKDIFGAFEDFPVSLVPNGVELIEGLNVPYELSSNYGGWNLVSDGTNYYFV